MNYFQYYPQDQARNNWLMFTEQKDPPYVLVKERYRHFICAGCSGFDHDLVFNEGFDPGLKIRAKGNLLGTTDGFYCVDDEAKKVIESSRFVGLTFKPLPETKWHVVNTTCRVSADKSSYRSTKPPCSVCHRQRGSVGLIRFLSQIEAPKENGVFFSPIFSRSGAMDGNRDLFVTEDILAVFKERGIKGGMFEKLLNRDEEVCFTEAAAVKAPFKWPKGARAVL